MKLNAAQFTEFGIRVQAMLKATQWRCGQAMFNVLNDLHPEMADEIRELPHLDPFYNNEHIGMFLNHILEQEQYDMLNPIFKMKCDRSEPNLLVESFTKTLELYTKPL